MDKSVKQEIDRMLLLMERMNNRYTLDEALEMEDRIEHTRDTYTDLDQFLNEVNLGNSFVGLCYIQGYEFKKIYPTNPATDKYGKTQADQIRGGFSKMDKSSRGWGKLNNLINDPEFTKPTGRAYAGNRSMATSHFAGVLKITNYVFNWGDTSNWGKFNKDYFDSVRNARLGAGFGKSDSDYDPTDWHRNSMYHGIGADPDSAGRDINGYHQVLNQKNSLYGFSDTSKAPIMSTRADGTQYQKTAFKFGLKNIKQQWAKFCLVDNNGEIDDVEKSLGPVLGKIPGDFTDLRKKIVPQMSQDEQNFINSISEIDSNYALAKKTWLTDHIAYIVACEYDPRTSTRRYVRWINPDIEIDKFDVNQQELKSVVGGEIEKTAKAVRYEKPIPPAKAAEE